jgi:monoamine oxidase
LAREQAETSCEVELDVSSVHYHDWQSDPYSKGAYSYPLVGAAGARDELARPIRETLFFCGEATMSDGSAGTVHGALRSGHRAAGELIS